LFVALQNELKKFGYVIETTDSSIQWTPTKLEPSDNLSIATYNDHRMAMSFAPLCLLYDTITIENAEVVSKSYPLFWEHLKSIGINQTQL
jgi:3-phosphoshikimate 1-carboxyvinyltransferase